MSQYVVHVFGKEGCAKCTMLNRRLDDLLSKEPYKGKFVKQYDDLRSEDGLRNFCLAQCVNPNRIPAMVVANLDGSYIENPNPGAADEICGNSRLYQYLGIQTDYTGKGIITPEMIRSILDVVE
ncbi:MAG: hypothetical protein GX561_04125 [Lentisphaerae bacterium]|jgi:hypothetical protein|nr:hypothetical protein [Lentisphaerota bacterium]